MLWVARNLPEPGREEWRRIIERNRRQGFFGSPIEMTNVRCREMHTKLVASRDEHGELYSLSIVDDTG